MKSITKFLVIGPSWTGDMVMAQSLFITLKKLHQDCTIDVLAPAWTFPLLARMPEVAKAIAMPAHSQCGLLERFKLGRQLSSEGYDQAIVLPNSWKSALIPFFAGIPVRTGYPGQCRWGLLNDARKLDKNVLTMTIQRFVSLAFPGSAMLSDGYPIPGLAISQNQQNAVIAKFNLHAFFNSTRMASAAEPSPGSLAAYTPSLAIKILALCPGAEYGEAKRWPATYFAEVARHKIDQGWQVWLFGSEKDKDICEGINKASLGLCSNFAGRTSLSETVDLMSLVNIVVTNDSGLMHVAAALDKKIIALYGSSDPGYTPPLNAKARIISLNLDCSPCFKRDCPLGHTRCLTDIKPDHVLDFITVTKSGCK